MTRFQVNLSIKHLLTRSTGVRTGILIDGHMSEKEDKNGRSPRLVWDYMSDVYGKNIIYR